LCFFGEFCAVSRKFSQPITLLHICFFNFLSKKTDAEASKEEEEKEVTPKLVSVSWEERARNQLLSQWLRWVHNKGNHHRICWQKFPTSLTKKQAAEK